MGAADDMIQQARDAVAAGLYPDVEAALAHFAELLTGPATPESVMVMAELGARDPLTEAEAIERLRRAANLPPVPADAEDVMGEWCPSCERVHQRRDRPVECRQPGCRTLTDNLHGFCEAHR